MSEVPTSLGSTLRLSLPYSGFPAVPNLWLCFTPQPFLRFSLQSFPSTKVVHSSRSHSLPRLSTCVQNVGPSSLVAVSFLDSDALAPLPDSPHN